MDKKLEDRLDKIESKLSGNPNGLLKLIREAVRGEVGVPLKEDYEKVILLGKIPVNEKEKEKEKEISFYFLEKTITTAYEIDFKHYLSGYKAQFVKTWVDKPCTYEIVFVSRYERYPEGLLAKQPLIFRGIPIWKIKVTPSTSTTLRVQASNADFFTTTTEIPTSTIIDPLEFVTSDKDKHFTEAINATYKEDENITGLSYNKYTIESVAIQAIEPLVFRLLFWSDDGFEDTSDMNSDALLGYVDLDLSTHGWRNEGANQYYLTVDDLCINYEDTDATNELHVSLQVASGSAKSAGASGAVKVKIGMRRRD